MTKNIKFIYYTDALCGWCYGFIPTMKNIHEEFQDKIDFDVVSGGLFLGPRAGRVNDVAPHIKAGAYKKVEEATGVMFGKNFLDNIFFDKDMILNSLFPAIAIAIVKEKAEKKLMVFTEILLKAYYYDGLSSDDIDSYDTYAHKIGFKNNDFSSLMKEQYFQELAFKDFKKFQKSNHKVFPSFDIQVHGQTIISVSGSFDLEVMRKELNSLLPS